MTVEERVEGLERELRRARRRSLALVAGVCVLGVVWVVGRTMNTAQAQGEVQKYTGVQELVRAREFHLVDDKGKAAPCWPC